MKEDRITQVRGLERGVVVPFDEGGRQHHCHENAAPNFLPLDEEELRDERHQNIKLDLNLERPSYAIDRASLAVAEAVCVKKRVK